MSADRVEPRSLIRSPWFIWSWLLVLVFVIVQSVSYHWRVLPTTASGYFARGRTDFIGAEYEGAIDNLTKSIERNPSDAESYIWRGEAYLKLEEFQKADLDLQKALQLAPDYAKSHAALADYRAAAWDHDGAIREFTAALDRDPTYARCYLERAQLYLDTGRWDDAQRDLRAAGDLSVDDRQATAYLLLWAARARSGDAPGAAAELSKLVSQKRLEQRRFQISARFLLGNTPEPAFLSTLASIEGGDKDELQAEGFFLAGQKRLVLGDRAGALTLLRNVVGIGAEWSYPFDRARFELETSVTGFHPMRFDDGTYRITAVTPGGAAETAGLAPGETITAIDDMLPTREALLEMLSEPGATVRLTVAGKDGTRRAVALALRPATS